MAKTLNNPRREMVVYTPPGYEKGTARYPVLYLIHGGANIAVSWSTVGRANNILDNLLAEKKAMPMIVVMPSGWTPSGGQVMTADATKDPFNDELMKDIIPFVEANYRTVSSPDNRALSGLSMGGIQTLNIGLRNLGTFRYVAVIRTVRAAEQEHQLFYKAEADKIPKYNSALKLFWWGWGKTDIARANGLAVIDKFKSQGVRIETRQKLRRSHLGQLAAVPLRSGAEAVSVTVPVARLARSLLRRSGGRQHAVQPWVSAAVE